MSVTRLKFNYLSSGLVFKQLKYQISNNKSQITNKLQHAAQAPALRVTKIQNSKPYDLEERTFQFAKAVRIFVKTLPKTIANIEDSKQQKNK